MLQTIFFDGSQVEGVSKEQSFLGEVYKDKADGARMANSKDTVTAN